MASPLRFLIGPACAIVALLAIAGGASAENNYVRDPDKGAKPVLVTKNKSIDIEIFVDKALRRYPGLNDNLMAEARAYHSKWVKEAAEEYKEDPEFFKDGRKWSAERGYDRRSEIGRYLSIVRSDSTYSGGAHGNLIINTILWDLKQRKRVSVRPLFKETADNGPAMTSLAELARLAVAADKLTGTDDEKAGVTPQQFLAKDPMIRDGISPKLLEIGPLSLAPSTEAGKSSGLTFHYQPYAVGPYAEGPHTVFVPWQSFKEHLSDEGAALFGGECPQADKDAY